jgi:hypothetical protein
MSIVSEMDLLCKEFEADPRAYLRPVAEPESPPSTAVEEIMTSHVRIIRELPQ